jgi:surfeit locus 1 family protein
MSSEWKFRPTLGPTLFTIPALIVLVILGSWQVQRMNWKNDLVASFEEKMAKAPVALPPQITDMSTFRYTRVMGSGTFLHEKEILLTGRTFEGTAGFHVITPFSSTSNQTVFINRGWIPEKLRDQKKRPETLPIGELVIEGILRGDNRKGYFVPENEPENEVWLYVNTKEMATYRKIGEVPNYYVDQIRESGPYKLPIGATSKIEVRNEHLQYAVTWFLLAATLLVIYFIYHIRKPEE